MTQNTRAVSCSEAKAAGLTHYFTGKPCKRGHIAMRFVVNGSCVDCTSEREALYHSENPGRRRARAARWRSDNPDKVREINSRHYAKNLQERLANNARWRAENPDKERERNARWRAANPDKVTAKTAKRRARRLQAVPPWYGEFDDLVWREAAHLAKLREVATGVPWQADHMIPLAARRSCGLHIGINCQVIPFRMNMEKGNRMILTQPGEWLQSL